MNKRPLFAATLFGALSALGIVAMFSQTEPLDSTVNASHAAGARRVSLDPGSGEPQYGEVLPGVIEDGVEHQLQEMNCDEETNADAARRRKILRLR